MKRPNDGSSDFHFSFSGEDSTHVGPVKKRRALESVMTQQPVPAPRLHSLPLFSVGSTGTATTGTDRKYLGTGISINSAVSETFPKNDAFVEDLDKLPPHKRLRRLIRQPRPTATQKTFPEKPVSETSPPAALKDESKPRTRVAQTILDVLSKSSSSVLVPETDVMLTPIQRKEKQVSSLFSSTTSRIDKKSSETPSLPIIGSLQHLVKKDVWKCTDCFSENKLDAALCAACEAPRPGPVSKPSETSKPIFAAPKQQEPPKSAIIGSLAHLVKKDVWKCDICTTENKLDASICAACEGPKPAAAPKQQEPPKSAIIGSLAHLVKKDVWKCDICSTENKLDASICAACEGPKPGAAPKQQEPPKSAIIGSLAHLVKKDVWKCDICTTENKLDASICAACEGPKPGSVSMGSDSTMAIPPTASASGSFQFSAPVSGGFKFGGTTVSTKSHDISSIPTNGFGFKPPGTTSSTTSGGFKFHGTNSSAPKASDGFKFPATTTTSTPSDSKLGTSAATTEPTTTASAFNFSSTTAKPAAEPAPIETPSVDPQDLPKFTFSLDVSPDAKVLSMAQTDLDAFVGQYTFVL